MEDEEPWYWQIENSAPKNVEYNNLKARTEGQKHTKMTAPVLIHIYNRRT